MALIHFDLNSYYYLLVIVGVNQQSNLTTLFYDVTQTKQQKPHKSYLRFKKSASKTLKTAIVKFPHSLSSKFQWQLQFQNKNIN